MGKKGLVTIVFLFLPIMVVLSFALALRANVIHQSEDGSDVYITLYRYDSDYGFYSYDYEIPLYDRPFMLDDVKYVVEHCPKVEFDFSLAQKFDDSVDTDNLSDVVLPFYKIFHSVLVVFDFSLEVLKSIVNALLFILSIFQYILSGTLPGAPSKQPTVYPGFGGGGGGGRH